MSSTRKIGTSTFFEPRFWRDGVSSFYGDVRSDEDRFEVLDAAYAAGCVFWDTADMYGDLEELFGKWFKRTGKRDQTFLCTKLGFLEDYTLDGSPARAKAAGESSLTKLGVESIDFTYVRHTQYYTQITYRLKSTAYSRRHGRVLKHTGLFEVSAATLRRAQAVHPIAALKVEYSPFILDIEDPKIDLLSVERELGIQIVAYSPLGRGLLTGHDKSLDDTDESDFRGYIPRYNAQNFPNILKLADGLKEIGMKYDGATAGQVALAWLLAQSEDVIPIPGTKKTKYLKESLGAASLKLSADLRRTSRRCARSPRPKTANAAQGERYPPVMVAEMFVDAPELAYKLDDTRHPHINLHQMFSCNGVRLYSMLCRSRS
ncbi:NADP-dependent oxidoreductase domain-containing protein [Mycena vulgaris]|nr:NADP-dependent oxidoreductase domain-containing protein [Mycena vulgaris]